MNGAAVAVALDLPSTPDPTPPSAPARLEQRIGSATADAAAAISVGLADYEANGLLGPTTRSLAGETLAKVAMLQLHHFGEIDFAAVALEARRELHRRHDLTFRRAGLDAARIEAAFDQLIGWVLDIAGKVVADEQARMH
jgi:hypothetical protein